MLGVMPSILCVSPASCAIMRAAKNKEQMATTNVLFVLYRTYAVSDLAFGRAVCYFSSVYSFSALRAEKLYTRRSASTMLPAPLSWGALWAKGRQKRGSVTHNVATA